jgi:glucose-1-phosphate thymidylyltransferase
MKGLLLAGGHGTRLRPLTFTGNKHMIPIANEPMLFYGLRHLAEGGITDVGVILGPLHEGIEEAVGDGSAFGLRVTYIHQGDPKGLAHAVLCAREFLGEEPFVMYLGDNLLQEGTRSFIKQFQETSSDAVVGVTRVSNPSSYGIAEMDGDRLVSIVEKPVAPHSDLALIGVYVFSPRIHSIIEHLKPSRRGELEITDAIWKLHESGGIVTVRRVAGWWKDTGRPEDLLEANDLVLSSSPPAYFANLGSVSKGAHLRGPVRIGRGSLVASGVRIEGPVVIGNDARIESGARIGPCVAIGNRCTIGRNGAVSRSIIMDETVVEGPIALTNSIIGRRATIRAEGDRRIEVACILGDSTQLRF